ncbi:hypothetical protein VP01_164g16 [Puccinia sorghi]|uniref:6-phosphogluconolactonase n=1 Tax=Puccinia sorghi TaxID=27349 RepID=A0A0L6VIF9_9BASI|nr:hypothetical protein VP01_164g16 [Puccinia sorghi]
MARLLKNHVSRLEGILSRRWNPIITSARQNFTGQGPVNVMCGVAVRPRCMMMTTGSSKRGSMVNGGSDDDEPMGLAEALRERYVSPWRRIYERVTGRRRKQMMREGGDQVAGDDGQDEVQHPNSISEAWRMGMQGTHPSRFSGLRARASTPAMYPCSPSMAASGRETGPRSQALVRPASDAEQYDNGESSLATGVHSDKKNQKKSLLQSYLAADRTAWFTSDLDKRSQKIISFSVLIWSLSGVIYFTWFSPTLPAASPGRNILLNSSSSHRHQQPTHETMEDTDNKQLDHLREINPLLGVMTPPQSLDESPCVPNRRRARPYSMLSYSNPQPTTSPSPIYPELVHSRNPSFCSANRSFPLPQLGTPNKRPTTRWTLTLQLASIAREFSLPSTGGLSLHLSISSIENPPLPGPRVTEESWSVLFGWAFEDNPPAYSGLQASTGLPIAGRLEFDIDLKKARWFDAWAASSQPSNRINSQSFKLTSTHFTPGLARGSEQLVSSSSVSGVRTLITATRRNSCKSSTADDSSPHHNLRQPFTGALENTECQLKSPTSTKSTQASPSRYIPGHHEGRVPLSPATISSAETHHRQQLERLVESEEHSATDEDTWRLQQETMLRQATREREQIELVDQLEDERRVREERQLSLQDQRQHAAAPPSQESSSNQSPSVSLRNGTFNQRTTSGPFRLTEKNPEAVNIKLGDFDMQKSIDPPVVKQHAAPSDIDLAGTCIKVIETQQSSETETIMDNDNSDGSNKSEFTQATPDVALSTSAGPLQNNSGQKIENGSTLSDFVSAPTSGAPIVVEASNEADDDTKGLPKDEAMSKPPATLAPAPKSVQVGSPTFSPSVGRSVNRFSGEQELMKRRLQTAQGDEETQKVMDEVNRLVHEKAMAKEAQLLLNPSIKSIRDEEERALPSPVKASLKVPPPPPTRSKVIQLAKTFASSEPSPSNSAQNSPRASMSSPKSSVHTTQDDSTTIPPSRSERDLQLLASSPIIQGQLPINSSPPTNHQSSIDSHTEPLTANTTNTPASTPPVTLPHSSLTNAPQHSIKPCTEPRTANITTTTIPVTQGESLSHASPPLNGLQRSIAPRTEPLPPNTTSKSTPSSSNSSPASRAASLFKPRLSIGNNLLSSIFRSQTPSTAVDPKPEVVDPLAPILHCYDSITDMSGDLASFIISAQDQALERHSKFVVAISGGSLPKLIASGLIDNPLIKWDTWKVFFTDERIVPLDDKDSNFANSMAALFEKVPIDRSQLVSIMGLPPDDIDLDEMAPVVSSIYMAQVLEELDWSADGDQLPRFDLILLGLGEDGHTCSLFPLHKLLKDKAIISWCNDSPKPPAHRITMTLSVLNAAHELAFVCVGSKKDDMLAGVLDQEPSHCRPASLVKLGHKPVVWFVDNAAAAKTQYPRTTRSSTPSRDLPAASVDLPAPLELIAPVESTGESPVCDQVIGDDRLSTTQAGPVRELSLPPSKLEGKVVIDATGFGYPYNLRVYPAVYPCIAEMLYCPALPYMEPTPLVKQSKLARSPSIATQEVVEIIDERDIYVEENDQAAPSYQEVESEQVLALHQTGNLGQVKELELSQSTVPPIIHISRVDRGYPFNLSVYPPVYPHLDDAFLPIPGDADLADGSVVVQPKLEQAPASDLSTVNLKVEDSFGYPYNLTIYPAVYPHMQDFMYRPLPPSFPASFGVLVTVQSTRKLEQASASDLSTGNLKVEDSFGYPYNLIIYPAVYPHIEDFLYRPLPPSFPASFGALATVQSTRQAKRIPEPFPPFSAQVTQSRGVAYQDSHLLEFSPVSLKPDEAAATLLNPKSPVMAMQSTLSSAFYSPSHTSAALTPTRVFTPSLQYTQVEVQPMENPQQHSPSRRIISPSLPFTHPVSAKDIQFPAVAAAALKAPSSALSGAFFGGASEATSTREIIDETADRKVAQDLPKSEQSETDQESEYSHFSKGDSSIHSQTTLHQLTDDDWPPTPPSPDLLPSPDLMSRLATTPSVANYANGSTNVNLIEPQFPHFKSRAASDSDQSSSSLIESDQDVHMSTMAEASLVTPSVAHFHDRTVVDISDQSDSLPDDPSEFQAESTPRASAQSQLESSYELSTSPDNLGETRSDVGPSLVSNFPAQTSWPPSTSVNGLGLALGDAENQSGAHDATTLALCSQDQIPSSLDLNANQNELNHGDGSAHQGLVEASVPPESLVGRAGPSHSTSSEEVPTPTAPISNNHVIPSGGHVNNNTTFAEVRSGSLFSLDQVPDPAPGDRSLATTDSNEPPSSGFNSPILPPLNLNMDLSDPLSAATASYQGNDTPIDVEPSPSDRSSSNGFSLDRTRELTGETPMTDESEEVGNSMELNLTEPLPSITKRPPTPLNYDCEMTLESVTIDENIPPPPSPILLPFQDLTEISEALAQFVFEAQEVAIQRHGKFQLALGGSILPQVLGEGLAGDDRILWEKWEIFLVEEAIAPLGSPESVLSAITESILQHVPIPRNQVHSIAELTRADIEETKTIPEGLDSLADSLADEYENRLLELFPEASHETGQPPEFDLILISVGEEGQVGSLYPSHPMLGEANWFVAWLGDAWQPPSHRITLTLPVLNSARQFAFLAVGQEMAEIVADSLDRSIQSDVPMEEDRVNPAALVRSSHLKPVVWFTDQAAASLTDYPKSAFWDDP